MADALSRVALVTGGGRYVHAEQDEIEALNAQSSHVIADDVNAIRLRRGG